MSGTPLNHRFTDKMSDKLITRVASSGFHVQGFTFKTEKVHELVD